MSNEIRAVILDVDGTLVDSNDAHARAWVEALHEHGRAVPFERVRPLIGMGGDKLLPEAVGIEKDETDGRRISRRRAEIFKERYLPEVRSFPRVRELLLRMREGGLRLIVASSAQADELQHLLGIAAVEDLVEGATSSSDAERSKPDPDIVEASLAGLDLPAEAVVMLGDTPYDIRAASHLGVRAIALRCGGWADDDLSGAIAIYDDPADMLARYDTSPLRRAAREVAGGAP